MGLLDIVGKMRVIDKECKKDKILRERLEPWVVEMNKKRPKSKEEAMKVSEAFIKKYEEVKKSIETGVWDETDSVNKIEQIDER
jgi:inorganic pyrophosphatase